MTSITTAPKPIRVAQSKPRRAPSLTMVRLTGPTGTERMKPNKKPVKAATRLGCRCGMSGGGGIGVVVFLFFFDLVPDFSGNLRTNESVQQIEGENGRQDNGQNAFPQNDQAADE